MKEYAKDRMRLQHIVEAMERLQVHAGNLTEDELRKDVMRYYGIVKNIEIIGEAARMLTDEFKSAHPEVTWRNIAECVTSWYMSISMWMKKLYLRYSIRKYRN